MRQRVRRWTFGALGLALAIANAAPTAAQLTGGLISRELAASVGLKRSWYARAEVNPAQSFVVDWVLSGDQLLILTSASVVQALDANTGATLWAVPFGNPNFPGLGPAANAELVGVINGTTLYLLERASGRIASIRQLEGAPTAGPALGKDFVFVPMVTGRMEGYPLDPDGKGRRFWYYQGFGRALAPPLVTPESFAWTTYAGYLYVGQADEPSIRFRLETTGEFAASPAYRAPLIYAASLTGELFAIDEGLGTLRWKYSTGEPSVRAPAVVGDRLFVTTEEPMLHCVDAASGLGQWAAPGIFQFAAATKAHVYGVDRYGTIHVFNIADGAPVGRIPTGGMLDALVNDQTDRLFLISESGLVQCLHEIGAEKPTYYAQPPTAAEEQPEAETREGEPASEPAREEPTEPTPPQEPDPFEEAAAEVETAEPFGESAEPAPPAEQSDFGVDDENPFD